jgi:putative hemolysin
MPVNPFENHKDSKSSVIGIKETLRHLSDGKPLGMFPAGSFQLHGNLDKPWEEGAIKVIRKALLLYLFIFTLEIVGYFISKSVAPSYCKITIILVRNVAS